MRMRMGLRTVSIDIEVDIGPRMDSDTRQEWNLQRIMSLPSDST